MERRAHLRARGAIAIAIAAAAALLATACRAATERLYRPPTVALRNIQVDGLGLSGGTLRVALLVHNPNIYALQTAGMRYRLLVGDSATIATGVDTVHRSVGARDSAVVELPVRVSWQGVSAAGSAIASSGLVPYQLIADITLDTPVGTHDIAVNQRGRFAPLR